VPIPTTVAGFPGGKAAVGVGVGTRVGVGTGVAVDALREPVYRFRRIPERHILRGISLIWDFPAKIKIAAARS